MISPHPVTPVRPTVVTVAFWLQCALVGALLVLIGVSIAGAVNYDHVIDRAALTAIPSPSPDDVSIEHRSNLVDTLTTTIPLAVLALWLGLTAFWIRRGNNVARILTWVGLGVPLLLGGLGCVFGGLFGFVFLVLGAGSYDDQPLPGQYDDGDSAVDDSDFYTRLDAGGSPLVLEVLGATCTAAALLLAVAVAVLLATGPANRYFRPRRIMAAPWFPGYPVPLGPGYPPAWPIVPAYGAIAPAYPPPPPGAGPSPYAPPWQHPTDPKP